MIRIKLCIFPIFFVTLRSKIFLLSVSETLSNENNRYEPTIEGKNMSKSWSEEMGYLADNNKLCNFKWALHTIPSLLLYSLNTNFSLFDPFNNPWKFGVKVPSKTPLTRNYYPSCNQKSCYTTIPKFLQLIHHLLLTTLPLWKGTSLWGKGYHSS